MADQLVLCVDRLITPETSQSLNGSEVPVASGEGSFSQTFDPPTCGIEVKEVKEYGASVEEEPLIQAMECRICQEEDNIKSLEIPCACSGSLKNAHRKCVQRWCNEKGDITCEICHQDPRLLAMAAAERHFLEAEYDQYADTNASGAAFYRSAALILVLIRAAGFLLSCYIMAWSISILQRRRQRQEAAAALAATEVAFMIQAGQRRGLQFTITPGPAVIPQQEPLQ